jgi:hypothetical protein
METDTCQFGGAAVFEVGDVPVEETILFFGWRLGGEKVVDGIA